MTKVEEHLLEHLEAFQGFARKHLSDPELAADVVQESLLKALRAEHKLQDDENVVAWFYRILRNTIYDLYRRRDVSQRALEQIGQALEESPDAETQKALCHCLKKLMPTLKTEYAEVLKRVDLEGEDARTASEKLGISVKNVNVRLFRARRQLKERLEETCKVCALHGCLDCTCD